MKTIGNVEVTGPDGVRATLPLVEGSAGERAIDIRNLRRETGLVTLDSGFGNTAACESALTFVDGEKGVLWHRGYDITDLAKHCTFLEVAYLLVHGALPDAEESAAFSRLMNRHSLIHEDMRNFFGSYPEHAHPMAVLSAMVVSLSSFYPEIETEDPERELDWAVTRLLSKVRTIAAFSYKKSIGEPFVYPSHKLSYCENFLNMMFSSPVSTYRPYPVAVRALNLFLVLHADHEQNCSTTVVRAVGSTEANLYASISAGICALWGSRHGGANQAVNDMVEQILADGGNVDAALERAKNPNDPFRLMGFGHRVYKTYDPRAKLAKAACRDLLESLGRKDPFFDVVLELEDKAVSNSYFQDRGLYPNVDFYTGVAYRALGIPASMFTVLFALGRIPGWIANWLEQKNEPGRKIIRPRQIYTGQTRRPFVPMDKR